MQSRSLFAKALFPHNIAGFSCGSTIGLHGKRLRTVAHILACGLLVTPPLFAAGNPLPFDVPPATSADPLFMPELPTDSATTLPPSAGSASDTLMIAPVSPPGSSGSTKPQLAPAQPPLPPGAPLPPPTDIPPPEVPLPAPLVLGKRAIISGAIDLRELSANYGERNSTWFREGEINLLYPIVLQGQTRANLVLQGIVENGGPEVPRRGVALGEAYIAYKLPISPDSDSTAYLKVGQFQLPFGLLAVYDPHLDLIQPLYSQSLGERLDWGAAVSGRFYSLLNYDFAVTAGVGADHAPIPGNQVVTFRLGRTFYGAEGSSLNVGGSLLSGQLPVTDTDAAHPYSEELPPSGRIDSYLGYVSKSRIGGDATFNYENLVARGEIVTGADSDQKILGYFGEGEYRLSPRFRALAARSFYQYPEGDSTYDRDSFGLVYNLDPNATLSGVYDLMDDTPRNQPSAKRRRFTLQVVLRF